MARHASNRTNEFWCNMRHYEVWHITVSLLNKHLYNIGHRKYVIGIASDMEFMIAM